MLLVFRINAIIRLLVLADFWEALVFLSIPSVLYDKSKSNMATMYSYKQTKQL